MSTTRALMIGLGESLSPAAEARLAEAGIQLEVCKSSNPAAIAHACRNASAILLGLPKLDAIALDCCSSCRVVVRYGVGYDNIDLQAASGLGIPVCHVPDYCTHEVADHTMALLLAAMRGIGPLHQSVVQGEWMPPSTLPMRDLSTVTLGLVGCGRIGSAVARRATAFGIRVLACDPAVPAETLHDLGVEPVEFDTLLKESHVVSLHVPLSDQTHHLINREALSMMRPDAWLINTARGRVVDTVALAEALSTGKLTGAALDVFEEEPLPHDHPLRSCPNVLLTPHAAWYSEQSVERLHLLAAEEVIRGVRGEPLRCRIV